MERQTKIISKIKAWGVLLFSGWRCIDVFGYPPLYDKNNIKTYLVTSGDGTIIDHCQYYGEEDKKHQWQQAGIASDMYPNYREVKLWKPLSNTKRWSKFACNNLH